LKVDQHHSLYQFKNTIPMSFVRHLILIAVAITMTGCATLAPRYTRPPLPVAPAYPTPDPAIPNPATATTAWRNYFTDQRLQQVIALALSNNRDLRQAAHRVQGARAVYGIQRADLFPTVDAGSNVIRTRLPGDPSLTGPAVNLTYKQVVLSTVGWEVDFWGRVRNLKDVALQEYFATEGARRAVMVSLIADVADAWFRVRELDERILLARSTVTSRAESFRLFTRRVEVGSTSRLDLTQVEVLLRQAESLLAQLEQERDSLAHALTLLVGTPAPLPFAEEPFNDQGMMQELRVGLPSELLQSRPDIISAEHELVAAHANIGAARAAFFPSVVLTGSGGTASFELNGLFLASGFSSEGLFTSTSATWSFLPNISVPIFDWGRRRNNLKLADARRNGAVANYEKTIQTAFRDVSDALSNKQWLTEQLRVQQATLAAETERARLATLRYQTGSAPFLDVLDAERDVLSTDQEVVQVRRELLSSRVRLYQALGGGA
jgi:multidrug efflux system outer membrane protein